MRRESEMSYNTLFLSSALGTKTVEFFFKFIDVVTRHREAGNKFQKYSAPVLAALRF